MVLLRLEQEGVQALKQFVKDFEHKRSKNNTAWVFPDGEVIHVQDHGVAILKINDWRRDNKQWSGKTAPEIEIVRLGVHENFQTGNGCILYAEADKPFSSNVLSSIENEISIRPYLTDVSVEFFDEKTHTAKHEFAAKRFSDRFSRLLGANRKQDDDRDYPQLDNYL